MNYPKTHREGISASGCNIYLEQIGNSQDHAQVLSELYSKFEAYTFEDVLLDPILIERYRTEALAQERIDSLNRNDKVGAYLVSLEYSDESLTPIGTAVVGVVDTSLGNRLKKKFIKSFGDTTYNFSSWFDPTSTREKGIEDRAVSSAIMVGGLAVCRSTKQIHSLQTLTLSPGSSVRGSDLIVPEHQLDLLSYGFIDRGPSSDIVGGTRYLGRKYTIEL